ncbi:hypothetical protein [Leptospira sp. GIMC2001]|uniref:hypothetical protein n=1 Tax=Leptospira sp. GIMC2001 TaxID=1513297 RepID=UPI00234A77F8|nr:hypothetical protein [Leptospira sp. GIMC2001]WCL48473.1 hypothetical protein O4O04_14330 [Leptospira sp. GIMC2001]
MIKKFFILVFILAVILQCSTKPEDKLDFSFDEKAKYDGRISVLAFSNQDIYPDIAKIFDKKKNLILLKIFYSPKLIESIEIENDKIIYVKYRTERGDPPISYEEACEIVREHQYDMRESIT